MDKIYGLDEVDFPLAGSEVVLDSLIIWARAVIMTMPNCYIIYYLQTDPAYAI